MEHLWPYALVLVCPVSMGVMMWMMMDTPGDRGGKAALKRRIEELESAARRAQATGSSGPNESPKEARPESEVRRGEA